MTAEQDVVVSLVFQSHIPTMLDLPVVVFTSKLTEADGIIIQSIQRSRL